MEFQPDEASALLSDTSEPFQLSLQDIARHGLRTASVLRTSFRSSLGVRAVFADTVGTNRACTAWASADGAWHWAGASPLEA